MRKLSGFALACGVASVLMTGLAHGQNRPGNPVVPFNFPDLNGTFHNPTQYKGQAMVLWFFGWN